MLQSMVAAIGMFFAGIFGADQPTVPLPDSAFLPTPYEVSQTAAATAATEQGQPASGESVPSPAVIERQTIIREVLPESVVTRAELDASLAALRTDLLSVIAGSLPRAYTLASPSYSPPVSLATFAQSQRIDNLGNVTITNATVSGVSGLTDADIPDGITASNYVPLSGGSVAGERQVWELYRLSSPASNLVANRERTLQVSFKRLAQLCAVSQCASPTAVLAQADSEALCECDAPNLFVRMFRCLSGYADRRFRS